MEDRIDKATDLLARYAMEAVRLSTEQLERHGLADQLEDLMDASEIDDQIFEQKQDRICVDTQHPTADLEQEIDAETENEVSRLSHDTCSCCR